MEFIIVDGHDRNVERHKGVDRFEFWRDVISDEYVNLDCDGIHADNIREFTGSIRSGTGFGPVQFSEVIADPQIAIRSKRQIAQSNEDDFLISFQLQSECVVSQSGRSAHLTPGSFALYDSTSPYSLAFDEPFHQFVLQMPRDVLLRHLLEPEKYTATAISATSGIGLVLQNFIFSLVRELSVPENQPGELLAENIVNLIALSLSSTVVNSDFVESGCVRDVLIRRVRQFIDSNLYDPRLNNGRIAASQGVSLRYLHKLFQNEDETIHEYILNKRLTAARLLLEESKPTGPSVEQVAFHVGFSSASHFSRSFKARFGVCPSEVCSK